jgi:hypothetical protein
MLVPFLMYLTDAGPRWRRIRGCWPTSSATMKTRWQSWLPEREGARKTAFSFVPLLVGVHSHVRWGAMKTTVLLFSRTMLDGWNPSGDGVKIGENTQKNKTSHQSERSFLRWHGFHPWGTKRITFSTLLPEWWREEFWWSPWTWSHGRKKYYPTGSKEMKT